ncbi:hypothetical protein AB0L41_49775 [Amycolatopsis mediterranei]|uniref:hypothetical protein n=1 Tax=Amycolatopsis mediterranei TaxID=33910 RepID=UPI003422C704
MDVDEEYLSAPWRWDMRGPVPTGETFTTADIQESKKIFAEQARDRAPLVRTI